MSENKGRYNLWLKQALYDLRMAKLAQENGFFEWTCFCAEQSAEKSLKAYLLFKDWKIPHLHRLSVLFRICQRIDPEFKKLRLPFQALENFTFISRYPYAIPEENRSPHNFIKEEESRLCLRESEKILETIKRLVETESPAQNQQSSDFKNKAF